MVLYQTFVHTHTRLNTLVCILTPAFACQTKKHKSRLMYKYTKQTNVGRKITEPKALCHCRRFANGGSLTQNSQQQNGGSHSLLRTSGVPVLVSNLSNDSMYSESIETNNKPIDQSVMDWS